ncbi:diguanylate cyclase [Leptospira meyeri]|uniref:diguanylate cyclase n=1 Tax=Leptospira meyeri TaxID=29508 RepID=UPI000C2B3FE8|nr:diguanylate cyclase [Leptospira meyeri]MCW7487590.1 diguanylate cyclase [Leptospira meyeri]PJZ79604.1 diguanylate cyclase [Leptospira meyeri]PJZ95992.1 diguanylate cyclase [Leptospira meyeri]PKA10680.1 diguanylate cyclase [Leptospira meyeri]TGL13693.1 diguanylate cyclase [Leptospira meyeri]
MLKPNATNRPGQRIEDTIMAILEENPNHEEFLFQKIKDLPAYHLEDSQIYSAILKVLTSLEIPENESESIWSEIIQNQTKLNQCMGRQVGFRVALFDYFTNINPKIKNPKTIEMKLFADTEKLILVDELTRLYNRRHFETALIREFKQSTRYNQNLTLLIIDIDDFKKINDTYGHTTGDEILAKVAKQITSCLRMEDTACRIGGEEFAVIFPQTNEEQALIASEKLLEACRTIQLSGKSVTLSGGIVSYPEKVKTCEEMYDLADRALYTAKYSGKNQIVAYSNEKRSSLRFDANLELLFILPDKTLKTISKNISVTGIAFDTEDDIMLNESFDVKLRESDTNQEINAKIKVVRKEEFGFHKYHMGAEFLELSLEDQSKLSDLYTLHRYKSKIPTGAVS